MIAPPNAETTTSPCMLSDLDPNMPLVFDIETGPEPNERLAELFDFDEEKVAGYIHPNATFDEEKVKFGNLGPEKRAAKLHTLRAKFNEAKSDSPAVVDKARDEAWTTFRHKAALDATTGQILAIGYGQAPDKVVVDYVHGDHYRENDLLSVFWELFAHAHRHSCMIGFNSTDFDLPFLIQRSWRHGIVPHSAVADLYQRRKNKFHLDLMDVWRIGNAHQKMRKLDYLAAFLDLPRKTGDGAHFHHLFNGTLNERAEALAYAENDIRMTLALAERLSPR